MNKFILLPVILILLVSIVSARDLEINELKVIVGDEDQIMGDSDTFNELVEPGQDIEFEIELENNMDDTDIEDIIITITLQDITKGEDLKEETAKFDLNQEKIKVKSLELDIPDDADEVIKTAEINIRGVDENNTVHEINWVLFF